MLQAGLLEHVTAPYLQIGANFVLPYEMSSLGGPYRRLNTAIQVLPIGQYCVITRENHLKLVCPIQRSHVHVKTAYNIDV